MRMVVVILALMAISLIVIASHTLPEGIEDGFFTPLVWQQSERMLLGAFLFLFCAGFDYNKLREASWILYALMVLSLIGLFFTDAIQSVHRWYRIPLLNISFQPSEYAKLVVVIVLSWFLERSQAKAHRWPTALIAATIVGIPFLLILRQPDLGTALILFPIALVMFYFGGIHPFVVRMMSWAGGIALLLIASIFLEVIPLETVRPWVTVLLKEYQFDRLDPKTHHQKAAVTAIAVGGIIGKGWRKGEYAQGGWLPTPYTDSVFPAFGEEFGLVGLLLLLSLFYALIYLCFHVVTITSDPFGRLLSAGIASYIAMHVLINVGMMCGLLPITGVPLILITYGGSSVLLTMGALGIIQSIYCRRFMF